MTKPKVRKKVFPVWKRCEDCSDNSRYYPQAKKCSICGGLLLEE